MYFILLEAGENSDILRGIRALLQSVGQALARSSGRWAPPEEDASLKRLAGPEWRATGAQGC